MTLDALVSKLGFAADAAEAVLKYEGLDAPDELISKLTHPETAEGAYLSLRELSDKSKSGLDILRWHLTAALKTYENYRAAGLSEGLFLATMGCFPRFLEEHRASFGYIGFDRDFWTRRQLAMRLYRIGELEYEWLDTDTSLHMHIPSSSDISHECVRKSYAELLELSPVCFPDWRGGVTLNSWLISPALRDLLPEVSRIRRFQELFDVQRWDKESDGFLQWVYGRVDIPLAELPDGTALQRAVKRHLMDGGKIGCAFGTFIPPR